MKPTSSVPFSGLVYALLLGGSIASTAHAEMRDARICSDHVTSLLVPVALYQHEFCYSGFDCRVGMRGDWLDLTSQVLTSRVGRPSSGHSVDANASIYLRGTDTRQEACLAPANKDREGFVIVELTHLSGSGRLRITANRPGPLGVGVHSDHYDVEVRDGSRYVRPFGIRYSARKGESKVIELVGMGLTDVRMKVRPVVQASVTGGSTTASATRTAAMVSASRASITPQQLSNLHNAVSSRPLSAASGGASQASAAVSPPVQVPTPDVTILGKTQTMLRLQVNFKERGIYSLGDYLEFADGEPPINRDLGWPTVDVAF